MVVSHVSTFILQLHYAGGSLLRKKDVGRAINVVFLEAPGVGADLFYVLLELL